jgi:hypothetical protein
MSDYGQYQHLAYACSYLGNSHTIVMGKIFSPVKVMFGHIPEQQDFELAKNRFVHLSEAAIKAGLLSGSFIYGSVAIGKQRIRSDLDVFICLPDNTDLSLTVAKEIVQEVSAPGLDYVPVQPLIQTEQTLLSGHHEIDRYFGQHLTSKDRIVQGEDPADYIEFNNDPAKDILSRYLYQKRRRLLQTYTSVKPTDVEEGGLQRMLELPMAIGRKTLQALADVNYIDNAVDETANKRLVLQQSHSVFSDLGLDRHYTRLGVANMRYDIALKSAIDHRMEVNGRPYKETLEALHGLLPETVRWLEDIEQVVLPILIKKTNIY